MKRIYVTDEAHRKLNMLAAYDNKGKADMASSIIEDRYEKECRTKVKK